MGDSEVPQLGCLIAVSEKGAAPSPNDRSDGDTVALQNWTEVSSKRSVKAKEFPPLAKKEQYEDDNSFSPLQVNGNNQQEEESHVDEITQKANLTDFIKKTEIYKKKGKKTRKLRRSSEEEYRKIQ